MESKGVEINFLFIKKIRKWKIDPTMNFIYLFFLVLSVIFLKVRLVKVCHD